MLFEEDFLMDYECIQSGKYTVSFRSKERKLKTKTSSVRRSFNKLTKDGKELTNPKIS